MSELPRLTGALSGRYFLERELGQGWNATVYVAEDIRRGGQVAMKVVRPELSAALDGAPFLDVMEQVAAITHPGLLPLIDAGATDGMLFTVTPFVNAESLRERLVRDQRLEVDAAVEVLHDVLDAVAAVHAKAFAHGGIKAENVLFAPEGLLLTDLGFDLALRRAGRGRFSARDFLPRRPHYLSPERARFADPDQASDIYAVGCLGYEMLAGVPPFEGSSAVDILERILDEIPEPLVTYRPDAPERLLDAIERALAKDPANRPATAAAFWDMIR